MSSSPKRITAVVFDFDLTLADSMAGFYACHRFAARTHGLPLPDDARVGRTIGMALPLAFRDLYGSDGEALVAAYARDYQAHADEVMTGLTVMLPGAAEAVLSLRAAGLQLAILSQKLRYRIEAVLEREGLLASFDVILGGEDVPAFKPDPRGLLLALERLQAAPATSLFAGDTVIDAETARNAGVPFAAVLAGFTTGEEFTSHAPQISIASVAELPALLLS